MNDFSVSIYFVITHYCLVLAVREEREPELSRRAVLSRRLLTPMANNVFLIEKSSDSASMEEEGCPGEFHLEGVTLFSVSIFGILGNLFFRKSIIIL